VHHLPALNKKRIENKLKILLSFFKNGTINAQTLQNAKEDYILYLMKYTMIEDLIPITTKGQRDQYLRKLTLNSLIKEFKQDYNLFRI
jgi:hypothetical protein